MRARVGTTLGRRSRYGICWYFMTEGSPSQIAGGVQWDIPEPSPAACAGQCWSAQGNNRQSHRSTTPGAHIAPTRCPPSTVSRPASRATMPGILESARVRVAGALQPSAATHRDLARFAFIRKSWLLFIESQPRPATKCLNSARRSSNQLPEPGASENNCAAIIQLAAAETLSGHPAPHLHAL